MHCKIRIVRSAAPELVEVGAVAGRRGDDLVVLVSALLPHREQTMAVARVVSDEEWDQIVVERALSTRSTLVTVS